MSATITARQLHAMFFAHSYFLRYFYVNFKKNDTHLFISQRYGIDLVLNDHNNSQENKLNSAL